MYDWKAMLIEIQYAVAKHPGFRAVGNPSLTVDGDGWTASIDGVRGRSRKRRPHTLHGHGDTPEDAVDDLIKGLDAWAEVLAE